MKILHLRLLLDPGEQGDITGDPTQPGLSPDFSPTLLYTCLHFFFIVKVNTPANTIIHLVTYFSVASDSLSSYSDKSFLHISMDPVLPLGGKDVQLQSPPIHSQAHIFDPRRTSTICWYGFSVLHICRPAGPTGATSQLT